MTKLLDKNANYRKSENMGFVFFRVWKWIEKQKTLDFIFVGLVSVMFPCVLISFLPNLLKFSSKLNSSLHSKHKYNIYTNCNASLFEQKADISFPKLYITFAHHCMFMNMSHHTRTTCHSYHEFLTSRLISIIAEMPVIPASLSRAVSFFDGGYRSRAGTCGYGHPYRQPWLWPSETDCGQEPRDVSALLPGLLSPTPAPSRAALRLSKHSLARFWSTPIPSAPAKQQARGRVTASTGCRGVLLWRGVGWSAFGHSYFKAGRTTDSKL